MTDKDYISPKVSDKLNEPDNLFRLLTRMRAVSHSELTEACRRELGFNVDTSEPNPFRPIPTPVEKRKLDNSCVSGHMSDNERAMCPYCRQSRFNTIATGYYNDAPSLPQFQQRMKELFADGHMANADYRFVLEYLGLPPNVDPDTLQKFYRRVHKIETVSLMAKGTPVTQYVKHPLSGKMVPLAAPYSGKSGFMARIIANDPDLREIYAGGIFIDYEGPTKQEFDKSLKDLLGVSPIVADEVHQPATPSFFTGPGAVSPRLLAISDVHIGGFRRGQEQVVSATRRSFGLRSKIALDSLIKAFSGLPMGSGLRPEESNRQARRHKEATVTAKIDNGYVAKVAHGPKKRGDKNATQYVKEVKPNPLLKGLMKKAGE